MKNFTRFVVALAAMLLGTAVVSHAIPGSQTPAASLMPGEPTPGPDGEGFLVPGEPTPGPDGEGFLVPGEPTPGPDGEGFLVPGEPTPGPDGEGF